MKKWTLFAALAFTLSGALAPLAAQAQSKPLAYRVTADVVAAKVCIPRLTFNPGDTVVFRAEVADLSGARLDAAKIKALGLTGVVTLKDGTKIPLSFGVHPPFPNAPATDTYWAGAYYIKPDHPTGTLPYTVTVTDAAGNVVNFVPIGQANGLSVLTVAEKGPVTPPKS